MYSYWQINEDISLIKLEFFQSLTVTEISYDFTTGNQTNYFKKKKNKKKQQTNVIANSIKSLCAILHKSWNQHLTNLQLCSQFPNISQTIKVKQVMLGITGEVRPNSQATLSHEILQIYTSGLAKQKNLNSSANWRHWMPSSWLGWREKFIEFILSSRIHDNDECLLQNNVSSLPLMKLSIKQLMLC